MYEGCIVQVKHRDKGVDWSTFYLAGVQSPDEAAEVVRASLSDPTIEDVIPLTILPARTAVHVKLQSGEIRRQR